MGGCWVCRIECACSGRECMCVADVVTFKSVIAMNLYDECGMPVHT
jgi:hypothetical protein